MVRSGLSVLGPLVGRKRIVLGPAVSHSHHQGALLPLSHCWRSIWAQGLPLSPPRMCRGPTGKVQQRLLLYWCYLGSSGRNNCIVLLGWNVQKCVVVTFNPKIKRLLYFIALGKKRHYNSKINTAIYIYISLQITYYIILLLHTRVITAKK